jgi:hypothetical protein
MADSATILPPLWADNVSYNGTALRLLANAAMFPVIGGAAPIRTKSGVLPGAGTPLKVLAFSGMNIRVSPGFALVANKSASDQGSYLVGSVTTQTLTVGTSDGINPRVDLVIAQVDESSGTPTATVRVVAGTPAPSPSDPALTGSYAILARILVPANSSSVSTGNITDKRELVVTAGGVIPALSSTSITDIFDGQLRYDTDTGRLSVYTTATGWAQLAAPTTPRGIIGKFVATSNSAAWTDAAEVTVQTVPAMTFTAGRRYKITSLFAIGNPSGANAAGDIILLRHRVGGGTKGGIRVTTTAGTAGTGINGGVLVTYVDDATSGSFAVTLVAQNSSGSGSHANIAAAGLPTYTIVEDLGSAV